MTSRAKFAVVAGAVALVAGGAAYVSHDEPARKAAAPVSAAAKLTTAQLIGQRITTGYVGRTPPKSVLSAVRAGRVGGIILFTNNIPSPSAARRSIAKLQKAAKAGSMPPLFVMIDQEGGIVQRMPTIPPNRTPAQIGRSADPAKVGKSEGLATGRALKRYGYNVNLAPVVDIPRVSNSFLGNRAYSRNAQIVANSTCAFAAGNEQGGVAATFKHFPGLGRAGADTDFSDVVINASPAAVQDDLLPYKQCPATPTFTMVSSARYPKLGLDSPASLEPEAYKLLAATGFKGYTITDALETPQFSGKPNAARSAIKAGVDVVLYGQAWGRANKARKRLIADTAAGRLTRPELEADANRLLELKQALAKP
jgi:beta-N-acetylhexosaminidase